ncbi:hypothetical protein HQK35_19040 [Bacillus velezensis]|uniref:hypothetical protein n=1 Tax=Bacillus velezensis TaxID=492670 RepID=UPI00156AEAFA|nr:hypothetical protein [Bacillus velezensis]NRQ87282.1 hypothetical protein [Bacillus velezensis]NRR09952.1 hypothetical protein [Bacillus velezensis]NRR58269.1 hypothetical protein [Bacillus velezensis]NRR71020.1 hypothetical protein [Bacillus velezensis]NRR86234.1 hypothetical protein [Bacillus velezensis]
MTNTIKNTENVEVNEVVSTEDVATFSPSMFEQPQQVMYSTINTTDRKSRIKLYNAVGDAEESLSDHVGAIIEVTDMVAHSVELEDAQTGEKIKAMRIVLLTKDGVGYHSVSKGVASSIQRIIGIMGEGPWTEEPLKICPKEVKTRSGFKTLTLALMD